jgi:hypothetical protein
MKSLNIIAGIDLALILTLTPPIAWAQSVPKDGAESGASGAYTTSWSTQNSPSLMDQNVSREIKQAWSEGKNATLAMSFQENGEIAMAEGKGTEGRQYFQAAEHELTTLQPEHTSDTNY